MVTYANVGGTPQPVTTIHVNVGGVWQTVTRGYVKDGGQWRLVFPDPPTVDLTATPQGWHTVALAWEVTGTLFDTVRLDRDGVTLWEGDDGTTDWTDTAGLLPDTAYTYRCRAYRGGQVVAETTRSVTTGSKAAPAVTASATAWDSATVSWTDDPAGLTGWLVRRGSKQTSVPVGTTSLVDTPLAASTAYSWEVFARRDTTTIGPSGTASASTPAKPLQRKTVTVDANFAASYKGDGSLRGYSPLYHGYYGTNNGVQKSQLTFPVPADFRHCVQVHAVRAQFTNAHAYWNDGMTFGLGFHHNPTLGSTWPGSTGALTTRSVGKGAGTGWIDIGGLWWGGMTLAEHFRSQNAQGLSLEPTSTGLEQYGYFVAGGQMQFDYTIQL